MSEWIIKYIWREWGYCCAICHTPGIEIHHIIPWRESYILYKGQQPQSNLIALCPGCHAKADNEQITRSYLSELKTLKSIIKIDDKSYWLDSVALDDEDFLAHLQDWHRSFIYEGRSKQFKDYLALLKRQLKNEKPLNTLKGISVLATLGGVLRRRGSKYFNEAKRVLQYALSITENLKKTQWIDPVLGRIYYDLGYIEYLCNNYELAINYFNKGATIDKISKNLVGCGITNSVMELTKSLKTNYFNIIPLINNLNIFLDKDHPDAMRWVGNNYIHLTVYCLKNNKIDNALEYLHLALNRFDKLGLPTGRAKLNYLFGVAFLKQNDPNKAIDALSTSFGLYKRFAQLEEFAELCYTYGRSLEQCGDQNEALKIYKLGESVDPFMNNQIGIKRCKSRIKQIEMI